MDKDKVNDNGLNRKNDSDVDNNHMVVGDVEVAFYNGVRNKSVVDILLHIVDDDNQDDSLAMKGDARVSCGVHREVPQIPLHIYY
mmetsp:Transcript_11009/g.16215  ORF Transcript_11009/g.16215 Transcript_11009/m.16215 type:complete len:85 (+) Transcript_11009:357-611(+)